MNLTKNQKRYASVLGVCCLAFVVDRLLLSPPSGASADEVPGTTGGVPTMADSASPALDELPSARRPKTNLAALFDEIAEKRNLDPTNVRDAFRAPAHWLPDAVAIEEPPVDDSTAARAAEAFLDEHRLTAVMANGSAGYAVIDGSGVRVGQTLDGFELIEVRARSAVFEANGYRVELVLPERSVPGAPP